MNITRYLSVPICCALLGCSPLIEADTLLKGGHVYIGDGKNNLKVDLAIKDDEIIFIGASSSHINAAKVIDLSGLIVAPGFIDPHTHSLADLQGKTIGQRENANYRLQGVTTVFNGNDGGGKPNISQLSKELLTAKIGTNTALYVGHGAVRRHVMKHDKRAPTKDEMAKMKSLIATAMDEGALGLSTGLFYVPGNFSTTAEVTELAKVAAQKGGIYDSHIRDESTYNIGVEAAIEEVLEISRQANIPVHIAHIKALGVDVWGKSNPIIKKINRARAAGLKVTADQYPWLASGTSISAALVSREFKAGDHAEYLARLKDSALKEKITKDVTENLRRRGGAEAILITKGKKEWLGKTLADLAQERNISPVEMAINIILQGNAKIASFNMNEEDVKNFMAQEWVMTSSDGSTGHPRKYASFPKKFETYVKEQKIISTAQFLYRSSGLVADTFKLCNRGYLKLGYKADIVVFDPKNFKAIANFKNPERLSKGVEYLFINGQLAVDKGRSMPILPGRVLKPC